MKIYARADGVLFGRRAYEILPGSLGVVADPRINPIAVALHSRPTYVASITLTIRSATPWVIGFDGWDGQVLRTPVPVGAAGWPTL